jgi:AcrR family transcriptional regulator
MDTKQKILDSAERLFAQQGYAATSMRQIITGAGVNLAAIHYHFGSKEELMDELVARKAGPVNVDRMTRLESSLAAAGGKPLAVEEILEALLRPMATVASANEQFVRLMGRLFSEGLMPHIVQKHFRHVMARFVTELSRTLPQLPEQELMWRVHFMMGALSHTMCGSPEFLQILGLNSGFDDRMDRLKRFLTAGMQAPVDAEEVKQ